MKQLLLIIILCPTLTFSQSRKQKRAQEKADKETLANLQAHVQYLAGDQLEGRRTGSAGEVLAMQYISNYFTKAGLEPKGTNGFIQEFTINEGKQLPPADNQFIVNDKPMTVNLDYYPLAWSAETTASGSASLDLREKGEPWFWDAKDLVEENKNNPHFAIDEALQKEALNASKKGAKALIIFNSGKQTDNILFNKNDKTKAAALPVLYLTPRGLKKYFADVSALYNVKLKVKMVNTSRKAHNVVGYINNNAPNTVVLGAHYDHLGRGEDDNALDAKGEIHNGADDNASGTAALLELARLLKKSSDKSSNYLLIAFSGEELGLFGSKYWLDNPTVTSKPNYMINMDMVGRYNPDKKLTIGGFGTSPVWSQVFTTVPAGNLLVHFDSSGAGPSDHASFYRKDIPVLFFFTNSHEDYHKATDDWDKINYAGELDIVKYIEAIIAATANKGPLPFAKTSEPEMAKVNLPVTLGVMPDYAFSGTGMRIEAVSKGKLAEKSGLMAGDVLLQLGQYQFVDVPSYMQALRNFKKGDSTTLKLKRGTAEKTVPIQF
ncbi:PDZ domain-containing protein [Filimonas lacunae]|uniref:PDZ domain-containing protein n=1 Tax=Filimonas lacunae TaxID=477680 RepID=A0A173MPT4_9BACT|nr:M28 family peptidase [Filimonas lacunae]BAV09662.1 aminopeptidase [Filimonas lacunae]SIS76789.1 PDZ domain-containing protein [Filimonas lacunae]